MEYPLCSGIANGGNELDRWESRTVPSHAVHTCSASLDSLRCLVPVQWSSQNGFRPKTKRLKSPFPEGLQTSQYHTKMPKGMPLKMFRAVFQKSFLQQIYANFSDCCFLLLWTTIAGQRRDIQFWNSGRWEYTPWSLASEVSAFWNCLLWVWEMRE